jgi:hypothetical protein
MVSQKHYRQQNHFGYYLVARKRKHCASVKVPLFYLSYSFNFVVLFWKFLIPSREFSLTGVFHGMPLVVVPPPPPPPTGVSRRSPAAAAAESTASCVRLGPPEGTVSSSSSSLRLQGGWWWCGGLPGSCHTAPIIPQTNVSILINGCTEVTGSYHYTILPHKDNQIK